MHLLRPVPALAFLALPLLPAALRPIAPQDGSAVPAGGEVIDFEAVPPGTVLSQVFGSGGSGPIGVEAFNPDLGAVNAAVVFDSSAPTGDDFDLGTPHEDFGGPGQGDGGAKGSPFENSTSQGHILIVAENLVDGDGDGLVDDPDDADVVDSWIRFDFSALDTVTIDGIFLVDVEADRPNAVVDFFDAGGNPIDSVELPTTGDNGTVRWDFGVAGVRTMQVSLSGSGAIDDVLFTPEGCGGAIGDFVWNDFDADGLQDPDEAGIPDVLLSLTDNAGNLLAQTTTGPGGGYLFTDLCAGRYVVTVDEDTLPPGMIPSPCDVGADDAVDNDCSPVVVVLDTDDSVDTTIDFGYREDDQDGEGCTPGYWKQPHHFDSWPSGLLPETMFSDVFEDAFPGMTLLDVLAQGGGGLNALGRHTVAALLNAESPDVDYGMDGGTVVELFDDTFPGTKDDYESLKALFEAMNESGCPLD